MPNTITPAICSDFHACTDDIVQWQNVPSTGCVVSKGATAAWPFNAPSPITLPSSTPIKVTAGPGTYQIIVSCCTNMAPKNVTIP